MTIHNDRLFVGTRGYGIWSRDLSTGVDEQADSPTEYQLIQNYPNPFNPNTTITYQIPVAGHVALTVYDMLGRKVASLVNDTKPAGAYAITWDAKGQASGVYIYRLQSGSFVSSKRLILLK
jgi:glucuronoarabinoxylan endo-1,4-beta-xylanase